jgi:transposase
MDRDALERLSRDELIALVQSLLPLVPQIDALTKRVADLEARIDELTRPPKTPDNSSLPPSQGHKPNRAERRAAQKRKGRPGTFRALAANPDRVVATTAERCPHCTQALTPADQPGFHAYDHIDLPPLRPVVTRIHRHRGRCPACRRGFSAPAPQGMAPGSPFGPDIVALVLHLHVTQAIGFERLAGLMKEVFGVTLSEGAIANMLARAEPKLTEAAEAIGQEVRRGKVVASDETSARVGGKTHWQWVLLSTTAIYHVIAETRAAAVVTGFLDGAVPEVWVADRYGGQAGHGKVRQVCLAHLLRDAQYAIEEGDPIFAPPFKALLRRAIDIGRRRERLKDTTLAQYRAALDRRLDPLLATAPTKPAALRLWRAIRRDRDDVFRFITRRDVPYTNNACERALRPSVIFRKVTGCFRSQTGAKLYAAAISVIATGKIAGKSPLLALRLALNPAPAPT